MKKLFLLLILILAACPLAMAEETEGQYIYYGDYAYTLKDGNATIVECNGGDCGPDWDDREEGLNDRAGRADSAASFSNYFDGVWHTMVPDMLDGHPVVAIGDYGFASCYALDIILPEGLTSIGKRAFAMCDYTFAITIPQSVTFIGEEVFNDDCFATLRVIEGSYAAQYAQENGLPYTYDLDYKVFQSGKWFYSLEGGTATLRGYDVDDAYDSYDEEADSDVWEPVDIEVPAQLDGYAVTAINFQGYTYSFFRYQWLCDGDDIAAYGSLTLPDSVMEIAGDPFKGNPFSSINVSPDHPVYASVDGVLFDKQQNLLFAFPSARVGDYAIPEGTLAIRENAFYRCTGLTGVTIPAGVTSIGNAAFYDCVNLEYVNIPSGVASIGDYAFYGCENLAEVTLPFGVPGIGVSAFDGCESLTSVIIPSSVTSIGADAFYGCSRLTHLIIPDSVIEIAGNPFIDCGLSSFEVSPQNPVYAAADGALVDKQQQKLIAYPGAKEGPYRIPEGVQGIGDYAFSWCKGLTSVVIPSSVTSIGGNAFYRCEGLTGVALPPNLASIGDDAFAYCQRLTSVVIPPSVTSIGKDAFKRNLGQATLLVTEGSYAEQYAIENEIPFQHVAWIDKE